MKSISVEELKSRLLQEHELIVWDLRESYEIDEGCISAINYPLHDLPQLLPELEQFKSKEVIVYCQSGNRAGTACLYLEQSGFQQVISLEGGYQAWEAHKNS